MKVAVLIHDPCEGLGAIQEWLRDQQCRFNEIHSYRGDLLPKPSEFDWLMIMGGSQSLLEIAKYPYLQEEVKLIAHAIQQNKKILGVCLGAQLIAESLGAKTLRSPEKEVGVFPVELTTEALSDPIICHFPRQFSVSQWHSDMPGLPAEARILATSQGCPRQIIRFKSQVYGLQCHLEFTHQDVARMIAHDSSDLDSGRYTQTKEKFLNSDFTSINNLMKLFLDKFAIC